MKTKFARNLLEALDQVDDSITDINDRLAAATQILEESRREHSIAIRDAADAQSLAAKQAAQELGSNVSEAGKSIRDGFIVGAAALGFLALLGFAVSKIADLSREQDLSQRQRFQLFDSIVRLFKEYGPMTYEFVLERSYAEGADTEKRRSLLNELIHHGVIADNYNGDPKMLFLDPYDDNIATVYSQYQQQDYIES